MYIKYFLNKFCLILILWDNAPSENIRASLLYRFFYPLSKSFKFNLCTSRK